MKVKTLFSIYDFFTCLPLIQVYLNISLVWRERIDDVFKGGGKSWSTFFQIIQNLTPKYSVTNNLVQVTYKTILSLNDRCGYTFEPLKRTSNRLYVKELLLISE